MSKQLQILILLLSVIVITSCSSKNSVVSSSLIQKRKCRSGWSVKNDSQKINKSSDTKVVENISHYKIQKEDKSATVNQKHLYKESFDEDLTIESENSILATINTNPECLGVISTYQNTEMNLKLNKDVILIDDQITYHKIVEGTEDNPEEKNKVAVFSFSAFLAAILFIAIGFSMMISSEIFFMLIFGLAILLASIILSILALTKYKHQEKRKVFAKITLYTILFAPLLWFVIALLAVASGWSPIY